MLVYRRGNVVHQIGLDAEHNYAAYRVGENNTWQNWSRLDAFGCSTPADLASLLGAVKTGSGDANTIDDEWHMCSNNVSNVPTPYGLLHTKKYSDALFMQEYFSTVDKKSYTRTYYSEQWHDWTSLNSFGCSTPEALASLLGGNYLFAPQSIPNNNLLNISKGGSYTITPETTNSPNSEYYYFCIVIGSSSVFSALAIDTRMRDAYVGTIRSSDESVTWKKITLT